jgi:succinate-semialdehyde dehydrogenase/glutarate-semialdehyde dehydrogenase
VERIYVHADVAAAFTEALAAEAAALRPGPGLDPDSTMGPLVDRGQRGVVEAHVGQAVAKGARVAAGGAALGDVGAFHAPTVLTGCDGGMDVMAQETFGPVAAIEEVPDFASALERANGTAYGLAATVLTPDMAHAQQAWRTLRAGTVKVNAVWGGAPGGAAHPRGSSGQGFGFGPELLDEVTATKVVHVEPAPRG